jgi:hypothetical protein
MWAVQLQATTPSLKARSEGGLFSYAVTINNKPLCTAPYGLDQTGPSRHINRSKSWSVRSLFSSIRKLTSCLGQASGGAALRNRSH